jgi:DNA-binding SARP family transcriptional activator/streptogramin lyase
MEFRMLGDLQVLDDGDEVVIAGDRQRTLLALLLLRANEPVDTDTLIEALWPREPPANPENALQALVSRLRRALGGDRVEYRPGAYVLHVAPGERDLDRFAAAREAGDALSALTVWRGPPLPELADVVATRAELAALEELHLESVEEAMDAHLAAGRHHRIVAELEQLVAEHPLRERLRAQLMLALYRSGRQAEALATYRDARRDLVEELGLEPGDDLRALELAILRHDPGLRPRSARRRRSGLAAIAVATVAVAAAVAWLPDEGSGSVRVRSREVAVLDPRTGRVVAAVRLGFEPVVEVADGGSVWVGGSNGEIARVDVGRARLVERYAAGPSAIQGLAAGKAGIFFAATRPGATTIYRLDRRLRRGVPRFRLRDRIPIDRSSGPEPLSLDGDVLWASNVLSRISRIDLVTGAVRQVVPDDGSGWLEAAAGRVWSLSAQTDSLTVLDGRSGRTMAVVTLANDPQTNRPLLFPIQLDRADGSIWIAEWMARSVGRVDESTNEVVAQVPLGHPVNAVAAGPGGDAWAASSDGVLQEIDGKTNRIMRTVYVGGRPGAIVGVAPLDAVAVR